MGEEQNDLTRGSFLLFALARDRLDELMQLYRAGKAGDAKGQEELLITLGDHACAAIRRALGSGKCNDIAHLLSALDARARAKAEEYREMRRQNDAKAKPLAEQKLPLPGGMKAGPQPQKISVACKEITMINMKTGVFIRFIPN